MANQIAAGRVPLIHYTVHDANTGELIESTHGELYAYLHGRENMPAGLEKALEGLEAGAKFDVVVPMAEAYGPRKEGWPQDIPRRELKGLDDVRKGMPFRAEGKGGTSVQLWITAVKGSRVSVDANHPLAGRDLRFAGEVAIVRDATPEEHAHGHTHGLTGFEHH